VNALVEVPTLTAAEAMHYIAAAGYTPAQSRVGVDVWRSPGGKRARFELTMSTVNGVTWLNEYALEPRRVHKAKWRVEHG
jgi:hypothetical protein